MTLAYQARPALWYLLVAAGAAAFGTLIAVAPLLAVGAAGGACIVALTFMAPVFHLCLLLGITLIVPFELLNAYSFGGRESASLLVTDVLLLTGLLRAVLVLLDAPLSRRQLLAGLIVVVLLIAWSLQGVRGVLAGASVSETGFELRALLGWGALIVAMPIVADPSARMRLLKGSVAIGLVLGMWGLVQYFVDIPFDGVGHYGVRESVAFTSGARQIQGGLFGFPVAFLLAIGALASGEKLSARARALLVAVALANGLSLLFTFQRTFWVATAVGLCFLVMRGAAIQRVKSLAVLVAVCTVAVPFLAVVSPTVLGDAATRLLSVNQYASDNSLRARLVESRAAVKKVKERPWIGWGLGDEVRWGMPWLKVLPASKTFLHNGYIWSVWKLGLLATALLIGLLLWAIVARGPTHVRPLVKRVRHGCQATIISMLIVGVTFPTFRVLVIVPTLGVLLAFCFMPRNSSEAPGAAT